MEEIVRTAGRNTSGSFAPEFVHYNDNILLGENWNSQDTDHKAHYITMVVTLVSSGVADFSLHHHLENVKKTGVTKAEIAIVITHVAFYAGQSKSWAVFNTAKEIWTEGSVMDAKSAHKNGTVSLAGAPNDAYTQYFVGQSCLSPISTSQVGVFNVTFESGCRNNWHVHSAVKGGGQIPICVADRGYYQEWGKDAIEMNPGDCINVPTGVKY